MTLEQFRAASDVLNLSALSRRMGRHPEYARQVLAERIAWTDEIAMQIEAALRDFELLATQVERAT